LVDLWYKFTVHCLIGKPVVMFRAISTHRAEQRGEGLYPVETVETTKENGLSTVPTDFRT